MLHGPEPEPEIVVEHVTCAHDVGCTDAAFLEYRMTHAREFKYPQVKHLRDIIRQRACSLRKRALPVPLHHTMMVEHVSRYL